VNLNNIEQTFIYSFSYRFIAIRQRAALCSALTAQRSPSAIKMLIGGGRGSYRSRVSAAAAAAAAAAYHYHHQSVDKHLSVAGRPSSLQQRQAVLHQVVDGCSDVRSIAARRGAARHTGTDWQEIEGRRRRQAACWDRRAQTHAHTPRGVCSSVYASSCTAGGLAFRPVVPPSA